MAKKLLALFLCSISVSCFASLSTSCPSAEATTSAGFCTSFHSAAACRCVASGLPSGVCQDMGKLWDLMIIRFGSLENACSRQSDTSKQTCIDDWNCYRNGGRDSQGGKCSGDERRC